MSPEEHQPIKLFYVYAREDELLHKELEKHLALLQRQGFIESWYDRQILPGMEWKIEIEKQLTSARIIVLLISADFFYSDYCYSTEMKRALQRHELGEAWVLPVILRSVDWKEAPFAHLQCLPHNGRPITTWSNRDEAFLSVAQGIRDVVNRLRTDPPLVKEQSKREQSEEALNTKERWLEEGNNLYNAGNHEGALAAYDRALLLDSHLSYAYIRKGHSFGRLRRFQEALSACEQALQFDPYNAYAHSTKGAVLLNLERIEEAMIACHEALRLDPYSAHAYSIKAGVLVSLKRNQEALDACNQALLLDPNDSTAHGNASVALIALHRHQEAWKAIERSLQLDPDNAAAYVNRGQVFLNFEHYQQAITAYDQALRLNPDMSLAYICRGLAYMKLGCPGAALSSVDEGLRRDPSSPTSPLAHELRMEILRYLGHR
jgi:tetratricopeptide (TPR) repeat protein